MGLAEKQAWATWNSNIKTQYVDMLKGYTGTPVELNVDEASFPNAELINGYASWPCDQVVQAFKNISSDDLGKKALADTIKTVTIKYLNEGPATLHLDGHTLTVCGKFNGSAQTDYHYGDAIYNFLMEKL
ncbi:MAG: hypothetical protein AB7O96_17925 [Pseudobdellovibrionaceae bacterium]